MEECVRRAHVAERQKNRLFRQIMARAPSPFHGQQLHTKAAEAEMRGLTLYLDACLRSDAALEDLRKLFQ